MPEPYADKNIFHNAQISLLASEQNNVSDREVT